MSTSRSDLRWSLGLAAILAVTLGLRLPAVTFGAPLAVHPDEPAIVDTALKMIYNRDLNPHFFNYPSLLIYAHAVLFSIMKVGALLFGRSPDLPAFYYHVAGRILVVLMSTATVLLAMLCARSLYGRKVGLCAGLFLAVWPLHVANSFVVTVNSPMAFFCVASLFFVINIEQRKTTLHNYLLAGSCVGLALSCKYTAIVAVLPMLVGHIAAKKKMHSTLLDKNIVLGLLAVPILFVITTPFAILDLGAFLDALRTEGVHYRTGHLGAESELAFSYHKYILILWSRGLSALPLSLAIAGLLFGGRRNLRVGIMLTILPVALFMLVGSYRVFFARNIVAVLPFVAILAAQGLSELIRLLGSSVRLMPAARKAGVTLCGVAFILSLSINAHASIGMVRKERLPDTRAACLTWILASIPEGAVIARQDYTPPVEDFTKNYGVLFVDMLSGNGVESVLSGSDYAILSSGAYGRFYQDPGRYAAQHKSYEEFMGTRKPVKVFKAEPGSMTGPTVSVYKLNPEPKKDPALTL